MDDLKMEAMRSHSECLDPGCAQSCGLKDWTRARIAVALLTSDGEGKKSELELGVESCDCDSR